MKSTRDKLAKRYKLRVVGFVKDVSSRFLSHLSTDIYTSFLSMQQLSAESPHKMQDSYQIDQQLAHTEFERR